MDEETKAEWEKSKRIDEERMKAARNLAHHEESKANQAFLTPQKAHGFTHNPNVIMKNAERMANVSIVFALLGILFGFFLQLVSIEAEAFKLGLAGGGIAMVFGVIHGIGIGVGALTGIVALVCAVFFAYRNGYKVKSTIITASISLAIIVLYYILLGVLLSSGFA